jgi:CheY-like chemotaxis protein
VLVVEDNHDSRMVLVDLLARWGHRVEAASDGNEGVDLAVALRPDVALVDVGLPGLDGYEAARRLHARLSGQRPYLVAMTGYGRTEDRAEALRAGFDVHLVKPVKPRELAELLGSLGAAQRAG